MRENETNVAPEGTSPEPAKTAEHDRPIAAPGAPAGGAGELAQETNVSIIAVVRGYLAEHPIEEWLEPKLEALKAEILAKVSELVTPIVAKSTEQAAPVSTQKVPELLGSSIMGLEPHPFAVGDPVKVWVDAAHKKFHTGLIAAVHGEGDAYDVTLDYDQSNTKIPADGLEFDDRR